MTTSQGGRGRRRVVIVGGGFGGLFAARALRRAPVEVTLVDRAYHHLFQPLLYQCATGLLSEGQIAAPLRNVLKKHQNVKVVLAEATGIDVGARKLIAARPTGDPIEFDYDDLIVAAGMRQSYFGHDEFARYAPGLKSLTDAETIRTKVLAAFEVAATTDDEAERDDRERNAGGEASAPQELREEVAAVFVRAEKVRAARLFEQVAEVLRLRSVGCEPRAGNGGEEEEREQRQTDRATEVARHIEKPGRIRRVLAADRANRGLVERHEREDLAHTAQQLGHHEVPTR